jgi:hypothetical protein
MTMAQQAQTGGVGRAEIRLPNPQPWPSVACTAEELARLRAAYRGAGPEHAMVAERVGQAERMLKEPVAFPPEGGQHNQWYQCDKCEIGLETVDATHHRCPKCGTVYSGYPYDNVLYSRQHGALARQMETCAWAFALTGEERFARRVREVLLGYAERYMAYPYVSANMGKRTDPPRSSGGHVLEQTLSEASWVLPVCVAYDLVRRSPVFSAADHQAIRDSFFLKLYENLDKHRVGKSNWQTYHNAATLLIGGVLNRVDLVRQAIADPQNGFYFQMGASVLPGGMWYENSWSYHFYTLGAVQSMLETARRLGIDLYAAPQVREMYQVAFDYQMVDGTLPRFGDALTQRIPGSRYEAIYHHWRDPGFLSVLPEAPTWESLLYGRTDKPAAGAHAAASRSVNLEGAGHAILRSEGPEGRSSAVLAYGPFGGGHGHFDKLSFVYFGMGRELGNDTGRARSQAYRLPIHRNWYRATTSHNTVMVDRKSQEGVAGIGELFLATPALSAAAAHVDTAYAGILHRRLLVQRPGFLIVADVLEATDGKPHTFDWLYHNLGERVASPAAAAAGTAPEGQGFEYLQDVHRGVTDGPVQATVTNGSDRVEVTLNAEKGTEILTGTGPGDTILVRIPLLFVTRQGTKARFAAAIDPSPGNAPGEVREVTIADDATSGYVIRAGLRDGSEEIYAYDPAGKERTVEGVPTRAKLLCLRREGGGQSSVLATVP